MASKPRTADELTEWGRVESETRKRELADVTSQAALERVQKAARKRRRAAGLTAGQAVRAVKMGQRDTAEKVVESYGGGA